MSTRIRFDRVWKAYPTWTGRTLREALQRRLPGLLGPRDHRWALRDVSLAVGRGELVGIVGQNGAGKSTLLRLGAGIASPTRGTVLVPEDTSAVLGLGDLFDLALSGRDNAMSTALAAGLSARGARARLPGIFEFAELEGFEEAPLRTYSDGMRLRLAFGVVAQLESDALLLDEVIAVGDVRFQQKCMDYVRERCARGAAVLYASHSLDQIVEECGRALWLEAGGVRSFGEAGAVVAEYRQAMHSRTRERTPPGDGSGGDLELRRNRFGSQEATIEAVSLRDGLGLPVHEIPSGDPFEVALGLRAHGRALASPIVSVSIARADDATVCYDTNTQAEGITLGDLSGELTVSLAFERLDLIPGDYFVDVGVYERDWAHAYDYHWHAYQLRVSGPSPDSGVFRPPHEWRVQTPPQGSIIEQHAPERSPDRLQ